MNRNTVNRFKNDSSSLFQLFSQVGREFANGPGVQSQVVSYQRL